MAKMLYFGSLPDQLGTAAEDLALPPSVNDVHALLAWLRKRGTNWATALEGDAVQVTVNKRFADPQTPVSNDDEIAVVSVGLGR